VVGGRARGGGGGTGQDGVAAEVVPYPASAWRVGAMNDAATAVICPLEFNSDSFSIGIREVAVEVSRKQCLCQVLSRVIRKSKQKTSLYEK
jgi:hypothetical protein